MDRTIELIPLVCIRCSTHIPAEIEEVAWVCSQCGQGMILDSSLGLSAIDINYSAAVSQIATGKPIWVTRGNVSITERESYTSGDRQTKEARDFWAQPRNFFIPAYHAPLADTLNQALNMLQNPPPLNQGPPVIFAPVTLQQEDIRSAAEFIVCAVEAGRKDRLKTLEFNLEISSPSLWILP